MDVEYTAGGEYASPAVYAKQPLRKCKIVAIKYIDLPFD